MNEKKRENISFWLSAINIFATVLIAIFAYLVSSDVRTIQRGADERASAKELHEFWDQIHETSKKAIEKSGALGSAAAKFAISTDNILNEYSRIYDLRKSNHTGTDIKFEAALASFIGSYGALISEISSIPLDYNLMILKYSCLASTHKLSGWDKFVNQSRNVEKWKLNFISNISKIYSVVYDGIKNEADPNEMTTTLSKLSYDLGRRQNEFLVIPYVNGLEGFILENVGKTTGSGMKE